MRKLITLIICSVVLQTSVAYAATPEEELYLQLKAISDYLEVQMHVSNEPLTSDELRTIISDSAAWTVASQEDSGHFGYEYLPFEGVYVDDDGMVRQAGTLFALAEVYKYQTEKDADIADTIERAVEYFERISLEGKKEGETFRCITNGIGSTRCDLGSTALALIGILNFVAAEPEQAGNYEVLIDNYVSYIIAAKFPEAGFSSRYSKRDGFAQTESSFYNGESMLALVRYYQYQEDEEVRELLEEVFVYLSSKEEFESPLYLWIMAALKDMQRLWPDERYVTYATEFTDMRLASARLRRGVSHNYCAPLEGLVSAYSVLEGAVEPAYLTTLKTEIDYWLRKSTYLQLNAARPYRLIIEENAPKLVKMVEPNVAHGGFLTGEHELKQRIDFTQHCVSSYLQTLVDIEGDEL